MRIILAVAMTAFAFFFQTGHLWAQQKKPDSVKPSAKESANEYLGKGIDYWGEQIKDHDRARGVVAINTILLNFSAEKASQVVPDLMDILAQDSPLTGKRVDADMRLAITNALGVILSSMKKPNPTQLKKATELLQAALRDQQYAVRLKAMESLALLRASTATDDFLSMANESLLGAGTWQLRAKAITLLPQVAFVPESGVAPGILLKIYGIMKKDSCAQVRLACIKAAMASVNPKLEGAKEGFIREMNTLAAKDPDPHVQLEANLTILLVSEGMVPPAVLTNLVKLMQHGDMLVRVQAISFAPNLAKEAGIVSTLIKSLAEKEPAAVRLAAAQALGLCGSKNAESAVPILEGMLAEKDLPIRLAAIQALGNLGSKGSVSSLLKELDSTDVDMQLSAMKALVQIGDKQAIGPLMKKLSAGNPDVHVTAIQAIGAFGPKAQAAVDAILNELNDPDLNVQVAAMKSLGQIGDEKAIAPLMKKLGEKNPNLQIAAIQALGAFGPKAMEAFDLILERINDKEFNVRTSSIQALGNLRSPKAVAPLLKLLKEDNVAIMKFTMVALWTIGPPAKDAIPFYIQKLSDADDETVMIAVRALNKMGPLAKDALPGLAKIASDNNRPLMINGRPSVRQWAIEAIKSIENNLKPM